MSQLSGDALCCMIMCIHCFVPFRPPSVYAFVCLFGAFAGCCMCLFLFVVVLVCLCRVAC